MNLKDIFTSQPLSLWLSVAATLISLISLFLSLKNQRRAQKLDTLQRRTQLILKLTEVRSQLATATITFRHLSLMFYEFQRYALLKDPKIKNEYAQIENKHMKMEPDLVEMEKRLESMENEANGLNAKTDPSKIEVLFPEIDRLKSSIERTNNSMLSSIHVLEMRIKR